MPEDNVMKRCLYRCKAGTVCDVANVYLETDAVNQPEDAESLDPEQGVRRNNTKEGYS